MNCKKYLQLIIVCLSLAFPQVASASEIGAAEARSWAQDRGNLLLTTFQEKNLAVKYKKLDELFLKYVDLDYISKFVIGKHWREMTSEQQRQYQSLFKRYALGVYKSFPLTFEEEIKFEILNADVQPDYTDVAAQIDLGRNFSDASQPPKKINVVFRLKKNNGIKLVDIKLAESSLILSYRNRFYQMVADADGDMTWFLEDLETVTVSTEKTNRMKLENAEYQ